MIHAAFFTQCICTSSFIIDIGWAFYPLLIECCKVGCFGGGNIILFATSDTTHLSQPLPLKFLVKVMPCIFSTKPSEDCNKFLDFPVELGKQCQQQQQPVAIGGSQSHLLIIDGISIVSTLNLACIHLRLDQVFPKD